MFLERQGAHNKKHIPIVGDLWIKMFLPYDRWNLDDIWTENRCNRLSQIRMRIIETFNAFAEENRQAWEQVDIANMMLTEIKKFVETALSGKKIEGSNYDTISFQDNWSHELANKFDEARIKEYKDIKNGYELIRLLGVAVATYFSDRYLGRRGGDKAVGLSPFPFILIDKDAGKVDLVTYPGYRQDEGWKHAKGIRHCLLDIAAIGQFLEYQGRHNRVELDDECGAALWNYSTRDSWNLEKMWDTCIDLMEEYKELVEDLIQVEPEGEKSQEEAEQINNKMRELKQKQNKITCEICKRIKDTFNKVAEESKEELEKKNFARMHVCQIAKFLNTFMKRKKVLWSSYGNFIVAPGLADALGEITEESGGDVELEEKETEEIEEGTLEGEQKDESFWKEAEELGDPLFNGPREDKEENKKRQMLEKQKILFEIFMKCLEEGKIKKKKKGVEEEKDEEEEEEEIENVFEIDEQSDESSSFFPWLKNKWLKFSWFREKHVKKRKYIQEKEDINQEEDSEEEEEEGEYEYKRMEEVIDIEGEMYEEDDESEEASITPHNIYFDEGEEQFIGLDSEDDDLEGLLEYRKAKYGDEQEEDEELEEEGEFEVEIVDEEEIEKCEEKEDSFWKEAEEVEKFFSCGPNFADEVGDEKEESVDESESFYSDTDDEDEEEIIDVGEITKKYEDVKNGYECFKVLGDLVASYFLIENLDKRAQQKDKSILGEPNPFVLIQRNKDGAINLVAYPGLSQREPGDYIGCNSEPGIGLKAFGVTCSVAAISGLGIAANHQFEKDNDNNSSKGLVSLGYHDFQSNDCPKKLGLSSVYEKNYPFKEFFEKEPTHPLKEEVKAAYRRETYKAREQLCFKLSGASKEECRQRLGKRTKEVSECHDMLLDAKPKKHEVKLSQEDIWAWERKYKKEREREKKEKICLRKNQNSQWQYN